MSYQTVEETVWPVDDGDPSAEWVQRYGGPEALLDQSLFVASIVAAYNQMTSPTITQADAFAMLKRARRARQGGTP